MAPNEAVDRAGKPLPDYLRPPSGRRPHVVQTTHIQRLIKHGLHLAEAAHGVQTGSCLNNGIPSERWKAVEHALQKAAADLRHAAEELEAERLSCLGWDQV